MKNKNIIKKVIKTMIITSFIFITTGSYLLIDSPKEEKLVKEEIIIPDEYKTFEFNQKDENENELVYYDKHYYHKVNYQWKKKRKNFF